MIEYYEDVEQGSDEWFQLRCGLLTASQMKLIITPANLKPAANEKQRAHLYELLAQRITEYVEPQYIGDAMMRGHEDEVEANILYSEKYAPVKSMGFITQEFPGFVLGYSPDGMVGEHGLIECKSRCQKYQTETIISNEVPKEFMIQIQTGLLVSGRSWCDFISYCGGMPMYVKRVFPDTEIQEAIVTAAKLFHEVLGDKGLSYHDNVKSGGYLPTERKTYDEEIELDGHDDNDSSEIGSAKCG